MIIGSIESQPSMAPTECLIDPSPTRPGHIWHGGKMIPYRIDDHRSRDDRPAILVVVPYYNAAPWVGDCLTALAANDEPHDILVVDDGSRPVFQAIAPADNLVVCRFERNAGLITALNFAASFAVAQGYRYYVRQDADDFSRPERLRLQREAIEREQADLVVSGVRAVDESGRLLWHGRMDIDAAAFRNMLATRNPAVHSTWFVRTDLFARIGCYDERFKGAEDFELLQRIARGGRISIVPDELVDYQVRTGSILSSSKGPAVQTLRIVLRYFDPKRLGSYIGVVRAVSAAILSRRLKVAARDLLRRFKQ
jgi:glycosyltransferase involved in cell wall biosynthesis